MTAEDLEHASFEDPCYVKYKLFWNRIGEMVSFELSKEIEKDVFSSCHERGTNNKFWVPLTEEANLRRFQNRMNGFFPHAVSG